MHVPRRIARAALPALVGLMIAAPAAPDDRRVLVLRGRATDVHGAPIPGAQVSLEGTQRAGTSTDEAGQYELRLPVGSPADLARRPVAVRMSAERHGWRFELPGGATELGLEMHIVAGDSGAALCEARANQPRVNAAAVRALTEDAAGAAVAIVNFIGTRGEARAAGRPLEMTAVVVADVGVPIASLPTPAPLPAMREAPKSPGKLLGADGIDAAPRGGRASATARPKPSHDAMDGTQPSPPPSRDTTQSAPPHATAIPAPPTAAPAPAPTRSPQTVIAPAPVPTDTKTSGHDVVRDTTLSPPISRPATPSRPTAFSVPVGGSRERAAPLVIRAPGVRATAAARADSCACRIEGTVEVDSDRPLPERQRIAVALVGHPAIADTVELFMGSPRSFSLPGAPCGALRLMVISLGRARYQVVSREAMAGFRCEQGERRRFRFVLKPR